MYRRSRMTDGSLKLNETARISLSYTEMTSTLPWHQSVTAFCQWTTLSGSYDAFSRSVCSMRLRRTDGHVRKDTPPALNCARPPDEVSRCGRRKHHANWWLPPLGHQTRPADRRTQ